MNTRGFFYPCIDHDKTACQNHVDQLVNELHGLTEDEIVEGQECSQVRGLGNRKSYQPKEEQ